MSYAGFAGGLLAALAVAAGAFGAHSLRAEVGAAALETFRTASHYQLVHAFAMVAASLVGADRSRRRGALAAAWLFGAGILFFCGSLYLFVLTGWMAGFVPPLGGFCFMAGWVALAFAFLSPGEEGGPAVPRGRP